MRSANYTQQNGKRFIKHSHTGIKPQWMNHIHCIYIVHFHLILYCISPVEWFSRPAGIPHFTSRHGKFVSPLTFTFLSLSLCFFFLCCSPIFSSCHNDIKLHMPCEFQGWKFYRFDLYINIETAKNNPIQIRTANILFLCYLLAVGS